VLFDGNPRHICEGDPFSFSVDPAEIRKTPFSSIVSLFSCLSFGVHYTSLNAASITSFRSIANL
ncbi:MAG TPA: hypothetical protein VG096_23135, partial [Bryobacteraceae bacterium]|nr:hypothetical protein [Bryobacteraceae bacterium]